MFWSDYDNSIDKVGTGYDAHEDLLCRRLICGANFYAVIYLSTSLPEVVVAMKT